MKQGVSTRARPAVSSEDLRDTSNLKGPRRNRLIPHADARRIVLIGLGIVLVVAALVFKLPAELAVRLEPVSASLPDYGAQPVALIADERIFTLYAARNAVGFDDEYDGTAMHPVREQVRTALGSLPASVRERLAAPMSAVSDYAAVTWMLGRGPAPAFGRADPSSWALGPAAPFYGLDATLRDFHAAAHLDALWAEVLPVYQSEIARWKPIAEQSQRTVKAYLRTESLPYRQMVVIPNLLDSHYSGYGPQVGAIAYVVAGPTEDERSLAGLIEHELLHSLVGPVLDANLDAVDQAQAERLYAVLKTTMPAGYGTWPSALEENLLRAINLRLVPDPALRANQIDRLEQAGFLLIRPLDTALTAYERSGLPFAEYAPMLLQSLNEVDLSAQTSGAPGNTPRAV
jgi:hypothetical protein